MSYLRTKIGHLWTDRISNGLHWDLFPGHYLLIPQLLPWETKTFDQGHVQIFLGCYHNCAQSSTLISHLIFCSVRPTGFNLSLLTTCTPFHSPTVLSRYFNTTLVPESVYWVTVYYCFSCLRWEEIYLLPRERVGKRVVFLGICN